MKILYVEHSLNGHRKKYLEELTNSFNRENSHTIIISNNKSINFKKNRNVDFIYSKFPNKRNIYEYKKMLNIVLENAEKHNVDIIHFLDGDLYYRFLGLYFNILKEYRIIITFHHVYMYGWRKIAIKSILKKISYGVVHTTYLKKQLNGMKCKNVYHVEYPVFDYEKIGNLNKKECRKKLNFSNEEVIITVLGGTQKYKGLNILLEALKTVDKEFKLYIAGREADFTRSYIEEKVSDYKDKVVLRLNKLSEEEYNNILVASDIIILPYLKTFNGASGPLADGVVASKMIIGSDYGSLGDLITSNNIGFTFKAEDRESLSDLLNKVLKNKTFEYNDKAIAYKNSLRIENFKKKYNILYKNV
ncbi:glycosyltransferase family 4 protein [Clostridium perfringens]|uniref:glycosyltransferase family 4 protein n=1 Tax=Clostridium perfringens TaxID=1502 RepID=UPI0018E414B7|nr:glycosyltransferase family 4 protein [Clostridium perfringens]MBI6060430.1 glycosyltransferase family 4 protein [Clostridium perfringens]